MKIKNKLEKVKINLKNGLRLIVFALFIGAILEAFYPLIWALMAGLVALVIFELIFYDMKLFEEEE